MFCPECGKELPDDATFCTACGMKLDGAPIGETPVVPIGGSAFATPVGEAMATPTAVAAVQPDASRKRKLLITVIICALVVGGIGGGVWWKLDQDAKAQSAAWNAAHTMHAVVFPVSAPGYSDSTDSKIPLHVTGTDLDGNAVDEDAYIDSTGRGLELAQGTYTVYVVASPLLANGTIYIVPDTKWSVSIGGDIDTAADIAIPTDQIVGFTVIDPLNITDEQIAAAYKAALASGMPATSADALKAAVVDARQKALDQKAAEEAAAQAAAAEAARKAALHMETSAFSLDLPDSWEGCTWSEQKTTRMDLWTVKAPNGKDLLYVVVSSRADDVLDMPSYGYIGDKRTSSGGYIHLEYYNIGYQLQMTQIGGGYNVSQADADYVEGYLTEANKNQLMSNLVPK